MRPRHDLFRLRIGASRTALMRVPELSLILSSFNHLELLQTSVDSLDSTLPRGMRCEWVVVDDGSTDGTREWLAAQQRDDWRVFTLPENRGYAAANNLAAREARGRWLVFLNNDVVLRPGWFEPMLAAAKEHPGVFAVGNLQFGIEGGELDHAGITFTEWGHPYHFRADLDFIRARPTREFPAVTFACALVDREKFLALGGFDEGYRNGCEDVDLCLRARRRGWRCFVANESAIDHHISASPGRKTHEDANLQRFFRQWQPFAATWGRDWEARLIAERRTTAGAAAARWGDEHPAGPWRVLIDATQITPGTMERGLAAFANAILRHHGAELSLLAVLPPACDTSALDTHLADPRVSVWLLPSNPETDESNAERWIPYSGTAIARALQADAVVSIAGTTACSSPDVPEIEIDVLDASQAQNVLKKLQSAIATYSHNGVSWRWADFATMTSCASSTSPRPTSPATGKPPQPEIVLHIDQPLAGRARTPLVIIQGWAFTREAPPIVAIHLRTSDGLWRGVHGLARPDVARAFPDAYQADLSGFEIRVPARSIAANELSFEVISGDGTIHHVPAELRFASSDERAPG